MPAYVTLPGTSGNYFNTPDVNVVDADTAHCHQSIGTWVNFNAATNIQQSTALTPYIGDNHGQCQINSDGSVDAGPRTPTTGEGGAVPVTAGNTYSFTVRLASDRNANSARITLLWWDETGNSQVGGNVNGTVTALSDNGWTEVVLENQTAPVGAEAVIVSLNIKDGTWTSGDLLYWDALCVSESASASFVESLRIVNDLEIEAKVALDDYTPTATNTILDCLNSNDGYRLRHTTGDLIEIAYGNGSSTRAQTSSATGLSDGSAHVIKVTVDQSTGAVVYYIDGVQHDTDTMTTGAGQPDINDLVIGANAAASANWTDGDIYYVIVRDGIDGPVVARFDAEDWVGV